MLATINWRLVFRHVLPAIYTPLAAVIGFAILVAVTGWGSSPHINEIGILLAGSSFVLVFARVAARDPIAAVVGFRWARRWARWQVASPADET